MPTKRIDIGVIALGAPGYPARLAARLGYAEPPQLSLIGSPDLLPLPKTALFCSTRCPGDPILAACDAAARWRDEGRCVVGGFHSPVEKECLRILLRGKQPVVICPARSLEGMRIPTAWRGGIAEGRILLVSPFDATARRPSSSLARRRNEFVAALADELYVAYAAPGGSLESLVERVAAWGVPVRSPSVR